MAANIIGLPGQDAGDVGVASRGGDEGSKVSCAHVGSEAEQRQPCRSELAPRPQTSFIGSRASHTNEEQAAVEYDKRRTNSILVAQVRHSIHGNSCSDVWRRNEALRHGDTKSQTIF